MVPDAVGKSGTSALFPGFSHTVPGLWFFGRVPTNAVVAVRSIAALRPRGGLLPAMPFCHQPIITWPGAAEACFIPAEDPGGCLQAKAACPESSPDFLPPLSDFPLYPRIETLIRPLVPSI
jgi:hypothetical protein